MDNDGQMEQEVVNEVRGYLDALAIAETQAKEMKESQERALDDLMVHIPAELRQKIEDTKESFAVWQAENQQQVSALRELITNRVLTLGETVKGTWRMAVWSKGKTTWDGKLLEGMSALIPELNKARKVGEPSVSFREVK